MAQTPCFQGRGCRFNLWLGNCRSHMLHRTAKKKFLKATPVSDLSYCNKLTSQSSFSRCLLTTPWHWVHFSVILPKYSLNLCTSVSLYASPPASPSWINCLFSRHIFFQWALQVAHSNLFFLLLLLLFFFFSFLAMPRSRQNLSSPTRDQIHIFALKVPSLNHCGRPGKPQQSF